jgi:hypothetical protein
MRFILLLPVLIANTATGPPTIYAALERPEWWLVIAAVLTLGAVAYQAREMRRATAVMLKSTDAVQRQTDILERSTAASEKSVRLQEIIQQQWIQVSGWRIEDRSSAEENPPRFTIVMDISNPTSAPLTLQSVSMRGAGKSVGVGMGIQNVLAPKESFKFGYKPALKPEEVAFYTASNLVLVLRGSIFYVDAFGNGKEQSFSQSCVCGFQSAEFSPFQIASV